MLLADSTQFGNNIEDDLTDRLAEVIFALRYGVRDMLILVLVGETYDVELALLTEKCL